MHIIHPHMTLQALLSHHCGNMHTVVYRLVFILQAFIYGFGLRLLYSFVSREFEVTIYICSLHLGVEGSHILLIHCCKNCTWLSFLAVTNDLVPSHLRAMSFA